ncbi:MAG: histone deacetylase [Thermomicrobiales bacterium]
MRSRTAIIRSSAFLKHDTGDHPERPARIIAVDCALEQRLLLRNRPTVACSPAPDAAILRVHTPAMLADLEAVASAGGAWLDSDTVVRADSVDVARMAAGGAINAVEAMLSGQIDRAFVISRPPGHHATAGQAMGFCLLNSAAIAAAHAIDAGLERIAIIDWDVHHGNGTQDIFYGRADILYCSLHQSPLYPGTGTRDETGVGAGVGHTLNRPLPPGTDDDRFIDTFRQDIVPAVDRYAPQMLIISAGYDAHHEDPVGGMALTDQAFQRLMQESISLADLHCGGKLLAVLEGGYESRALARCVADAIALLDGASNPPHA